MYSLKEKLYLFVFGVLGLISLWFFIQYKSLAFPEYSIDFKISRDQAKELSQQQAKNLNISLQDHTSSTIFEIDEEAKNFLERNIGVKQTGDLAQTEINIWHFNTRFFRPLEKKEYTFSFLPNGQFIGLNTEIPENQAGDAFTKDQAQIIAEKFLISTAKLNLNDWQIISSETQTREKRVDHQFIWEKKTFSINESTYRTHVSIYGSVVGSYNQFLKIPESWLRQYDNERSYNNLAQIVAESLNYLFFGIAIIATFIINFRHHFLNLKFARNIAIVIAVITFCSSVNSFPIILYYFPTTQTFSAFFTQIVLGSLSVAFFSGLLTFLTVASGEVIYRQQFKEKLNLANIFSKAIFTKTVNLNLLVGTFVGFIFLSYVTAYYFLGQQLGFWVPAETNYSDLFNTYIPWIYPLLIGLSAAVLEEAIFRLFGITFLNKYLKNIYISIFITSVAWAFLHSSYPQSPWFARGLEISLVGLVLGWLYVRFGILASISAHYTFNALQTAIFFLSSNNLYASISSLFVALLPLIIVFIGFIYKFKKGGFVPEEKFSNQISKLTKPVKQTVSKTTNIPEYISLSKRYVLIIISLAIFFTFLTIFLMFKQDFSTFTYHATKEEITQESLKSLESEDINLEEYTSTIVYSILTVDPLIEKYFLENQGAKILEQTFLETIPLETWNTRFFKPLEKQEYIVRFLADGTFYSLDYVLDENADGAKLTFEQANTVAINYLKEKGFDTSFLTLVDQQAEQRPNRIDHYFTFQNTNFNFKQSQLRIDLDILGDKPSGFDQYIKLPEEFIRNETSTQFKDVIVQSILSLFLGSIIVLFVINFLKQFRQEKLDFKKMIPFVTFSALIMIASYINQLPSFFAGYNTSISLTNYITQQIFIYTLSIVFVTLLIWLILACFKNLWEEYLAPLLPKKNLDRYLKDATFVSYISQFITIPSAFILSSIFAELNLVSSTNFTIDLGFATYLPAIKEIYQLQLGLISFIFLSSLVIILFEYTKSWIKVCIFLGLILAISSTAGADNLREFMTNFVPSLAFLILAGLLIILLFRKNFLSYVGSMYVLLLSSGGIALIAEPALIYKINGLVLMILSLLPLLFMVFYKRLKSIGFILNWWKKRKSFVK